ncbi:MAG: S41 family peptidase [Bacteroidales bacterium]
MYKNYNYDGLMFVGKNRFNQLYDSIQQVIDEKGEMSRVDFYLLTVPLIQALQDDQSFYSLVGKYGFEADDKTVKSFAEKIIIPYTIQIFHDSVFITDIESDLYKSRIISINNIPAEKVIPEIYRASTFNRYRYYLKYQYGECNLSYSSVISHILFGFQNAVDIAYTPYNSHIILHKQVELLPFSDLSYKKLAEEQVKEKLNWYSSYFDGDKGVFKINSFPYGKIEIDTLNYIFDQIQRQQSKSLIIDISECGWSSNTFWIIFLNYLYKGDLWIYGYHKEKKNLSQYTKKSIKDNKFILGRYRDISTELKFEGHIYLIIGPKTKLSGINFADILRYNKISTKIYGSESLSKNTQFTSSQLNYLPVTKIRLGLSFSMSEALDKNRNTHGFLPDEEVKPNTIEEFWDNGSNRLVINKVIDLIEKENLENENTTHK